MDKQMERRTDIKISWMDGSIDRYKIHKQKKTSVGIKTDNDIDMPMAMLILSKLADCLSCTL